MRQDITTEWVYENRREPRKKTLIHAFVSDRADMTDLKCVIRDISTHGCRIASSYVEHLPRIIEIFPEGFDKPLTGRIVWRNAKVAGIEFLSPAEVAAYDRRNAKPPPKPVKPAGFFTRLQSFASLYRSASQRQRDEPAAHEQQREFGARVLRGLKNPLTALRNLLHLLLVETRRPIPERAKSVILAAHENAKKAEALVEEGLRVENINSGQLPCNPRPLDIAELAENALLTNTGHAAKYHVRFRLRNDAGKAMVNADAMRMDDVLAHLLASAAKASPAGETVILSLTRHDERIRISVSDRGMGSLAGQHENDDLELGFDICRAILGKHGSCLQIETRAGSGTTVWFDLPEIVIE